MKTTTTFALATLATITLAACDTAGGGSAGGSRDTVRAVGSSTVYPFAKLVAEKLRPV